MVVHEHGVTAEVDAVFRAAVACRTCFAGEGIQPALVDIAQPRWIGERYWDQALRTVIVSINPAAGKIAHDRPNEKFRGLIRSYAKKEGSISNVFRHQEQEIPTWGQGKFALFYLHGFGLELQNIALLNLAWCAEKSDNYPSIMLNSCFEKHTALLIKNLRPDFIILSGAEVHKFRPRIVAISPKAQIENVPHYQHRGGSSVTAQESKRIRALLAEAKSRRG